MPLDGELPKDEIEILAFEATLTSSVAEKAAAVVDLAYRLRIMGSLALSLCHLAAGRVDAVCSLKPARAVDIAAAQLLVLERGLAIEPLRGAAVRRGAARPRGAFTGRRSGNARAMPAARTPPLDCGDEDCQADLARPRPLSGRRDHEGRSSSTTTSRSARRSCRICATVRSR